MGLDIGPLNVRRSIFIQASPHRVWWHFDNEDSIRAWLDQGHVIHSFIPEVGATVEMSVVNDGVQSYYGGPVLVVEPARELSIQTQWTIGSPWSSPVFWTFRLTGLYSGTLVEFFHHGFERLGPDAATNLEDYESGWGMVHLSTLRKLAEAASPV